MAILKINIYPDPILSEPAQPIDDITDSIRKMLDDMAATMYAAAGVGLAAPQIGKSIRAIVVDASPVVEGEPLLKLINPMVTFAEGRVVYEEGCLSVPGFSGDVTRARHIIVEACDEHGSPVRLETETFLAAVLQHEIDHLDGILYIDHLSRLKRNLIKRKFKKASLKHRSVRENAAGML